MGARKLPATALDGLHQVIDLVRGCKVTVGPGELFTDPVLAPPLPVLPVLAFIASGGEWQLSNMRLGRGALDLAQACL